ncbi:amino acid ABC transporter ATP-binding protein [Pseudomonas aeruginosa]|uniref:amino acid ABC transporter ATP-binding protein n=1 Tax=Pseudomonas TaxID=286 RepID=UPI000690512A|nr:amino acid ABC transporter ATP-binding protein [Pseudomonas aeruginosa]EJB8390346.1 amino acid ABC transporter ATP-binding protein [Pseudomonas aeruginosa]ELK4745157.1 amino acid ABC transporter ATP-binding protein [Pseudomonas aeruginosa]MBH3536175.1 amino acid ABC transporter ATP-binding protein [Pseudomonas aeruginosa]MBM2538702.1 amino acid ABC transporter ATP-binding protein [Pseudomonas aeruginosa]MBX6558010.1 amino acid ABC transporter ATP-binding protein [Pseudomonas aeruginosa]
MNDVRITVRDLHKRYADHWVLQGISFQVRRAEIACLIGPSGSGKSTLLRTLNGLASFDSGSIDVCGLAVGRGADPRQLRRHVGMVFQSYNLFPHLSVLQNITLAPIRVHGEAPASAQARARDLLAQVNLHGKEHAYPAQLSGGQQQRVAIARSLAMRPQVMLFDEVTAALDPETVGEVQATIRSVANSGMTCLIVTHEMRFARQIADTIYFTDGGRIVEQGPPENLLHSPSDPRTQRFLGWVL